MAQYDGWRPYVSVSKRRAAAKRTATALRKRGVEVQPIEIEGRKIAKTFWGEAWCDHLESLGDYESRIPRGRTYVRNGSVCHLDISPGKVDALVSGSEIYSVTVRISPLSQKAWRGVRTRCVGKIGSLLELLEGRLSDQVMSVVTDSKAGLFPKPRAIKFECSCPDWASMCKHIAAVLYGVGARLDTRPELLFLLRGVDHEELIAADADHAVTAATARGKSKRLSEDDLGDVFGIDIDQETPQAKARPRTKRKVSRRKKATKKKAKAKKSGRKKSAGKKAGKKKSVRKKSARKKAGRKNSARK